ncbi:major facilitator superfamily MFS_1 [Arcobacter nitrofigilis DSM 7299]|uniref:Major facilitator superfamily MFS_1 n=1 Tax=Arcobacter nitrofigilis (strain ATCC 33309 / DSM 7299 / CCUG 15893 / LMG 7604 / NCTC 12251 / CI) TaxID=572480 RepID=D5UZ69_ARCNC|nr:MFS transporter [Arcobacter nitrofigilis]ADG94121.1 major facilitator superfamily MFS_1 [Arcobacter nitrofigilis DSM 7299]
MNYKELLTNYPLVRKLSLLQVIAYFGAWFSNVAIYTMLVNFGSSAFMISLVTAMFFIPAIVIAPLSGAIIDRFRIKPLMLTLLSTELCMTLLLLTINDKEDIWLLMILIFIRMSSASMFFSAEMTLLPKIVSGDVLKKTNEIHSIIWSFTYAFGMAMSGLIVNYFGVKTAIILDALFFILAILVFFNIEFKVEIVHTKEKVLSMIKGGFLYIKNNKYVLHLLLLHASVGLTSFDTLVTLLAKNEYKYVIAVPLSIGITNAIRAMALMVGPFIITNWVNKDRLTLLFIFQGLGIILWGLFQFNFYLALIMVFLTGFTTTTIWSMTYAFIQERVEHKYLGRVISYNDMIFMLSNVLTTFFIGVLADIIPLSFITIILGLAFILVAFYYKTVVKVFL